MKLILLTVLPLTCATEHHILITDGCNLQARCVLFQERSLRTNKAIDYWLISLTKAQKAFNTSQIKWLAIVWLRHVLRFKLEESRFIIQTDHHLLQRIFNLTNASRKLALWRLQFLKIAFHVEHQHGVKHHAAHALSRLYEAPQTQKYKWIDIHAKRTMTRAYAQPQPSHKNSSCISTSRRNPRLQ